MSLTLKIATRVVTFHWEDDDMAASWKLTSDMDEGQIMAKILAMVKFLQAQPAGGQLINLPVRAVPDTDWLAEKAGRDHQDEMPPAINWPPARPVPQMSDLVARLPNSFEMIPPGDEEFDPA